MEHNRLTINYLLMSTMMFDFDIELIENIMNLNQHFDYPKLMQIR